MKLKFSIFFLSIGMLLSANFAKAQSSSFDKKAISMLNTFYKTYIPINVANRTNDNIDALPVLKRYCSANFLNKYYINPTEEDAMDADPFVKAQDFDISWLKSLTINKDVQNANCYIAEYSDMKTISHTVIHLSVVYQNGKYLINEVW
jgi:hypothetical protein